MRQLFILNILFLLILPPSALAAKADVSWTNYNEYIDIDSGNQHRDAYRKSLFKDLMNHFIKLATRLPADQTLKIEVTNLDLAGRVEYSNMNTVRVVTDAYIPRIALTYTLFDVNRKIIKEDSVKLKNSSFLSGGTGRYRKDDYLKHEKRMLDKWFKRLFLDKNKP